MQLDQLGAPSAQTSWDQTLSQRHRAGSHSAPIFAEKLDAAERVGRLRLSVPKLTPHVLPTPAYAKGSNMTASGPLLSPILPSQKNLWHSSPLDLEKPKKFTDEESSSYKHTLPLPPLTEGAAFPQADTQNGFDSQNVRRQSFSGPITSKSSLNMPHIPISSNDIPQSVSGLLTRGSVPQAPLLVNVSHNASPSLSTSPKLSELHELPRPPESFGFKPMRSVGNLGHSAPLVNRKREVSPTNSNPFRKPREGSPLPLPKLTVSRSFSILSSGEREAALHSGKLLGSAQILESTEGVASPPLTPISLLHLKSPNSGQIRGKPKLMASFP